MFELWKKGASSGKLRDEVRAISRTICGGLNMGVPENGGANEFEF